MRKILIIISAIFVLSSCTEQYVARNFGGEMTVKIPPGYKVTSATWKESDLFYFLEPMEDGYTPKEKKFVESSSYGVWETEVTFKESR